MDSLTAGAGQIEREEKRTILLWLPPFTTFVALVLLMIPVFTFETTEMWDHLWHLQFAAEWYTTGTPPQLLPHMGYHLLLMGLHRLTQIDMRWLVVAIMSLSAGVGGWLVYSWLLRALPKPDMRARWQVAGLSIVLLLVAPIFLLTLPNENIYFGYMVPHPYHNPTSLLVKPISLLLTLLLLRAVTVQRMSNWGLLGTFLLVVASLMIKPSYLLCVLPPIGLVAFYRMYHRQAVDVLTLGLAVGLPALLVMGIQSAFVQTTLGGVYFAPLYALHMSSPETMPLLPLKFVLSLVFPLLVTLYFRRQAARTLYMWVAWLTFAAGAAQYFLLGEVTFPGATNWWWGAQISTFILFVMCARLWLEQGGGQLPATRREWLVRGALALHVLCGVLWWASHAAGLFSDIYFVRRWW
jgi:hypothetical protein